MVPSSRCWAAAAAVLLMSSIAGADPRQNEPGKFDFYVLRYPGRLPIVRRPGTVARLPSSSARRGLIRLSCTGFGPSTSTDFRSIARCRPRAWTATLYLP